MSDYPNEYPDHNISEVAKKIFQERYIHPFGDHIRYVQLESGYIDNADGVVCWGSLAEMHLQNTHFDFDDLIDKTAADLIQDSVALILLAVQRGDLQLNVKTALNRWVWWPCTTWRGE